jgi:ribose 5-phosphate isomerase RpiB
VRLTVNINIEQIVQSVLTDLTASNPKLVDAVKFVAPLRKISENKTSEQPEFFFNARVVSLELLKTLPENATKLFLAPKTILTPSAKDEIRRRKIEVATKTANQPQRYSLSLYVLGSVHSAVLNRLQKEFLIKAEDYTDINPTLDSVEKGAAAGQFGVLLTHQAAAALRAANQRQALRAVPAFDIVQVQEDAAEINANVLIIHPKRLNETKIIEIIKTCVSAK